jgi:hypothetical protein
VKSVLSRIIKQFTAHQNSIPFLFGIAVLIAAVIIAWRTLSDKWPEDILGGGSVEVETRQAGGSAGLSVLAAETERLTEKIAGLNAHLNMLSDSATYLESKLIRAHVIADDIIQTESTLAALVPRKQTLASETINTLEMLPPPAAGKPDLSTVPDRIAHSSPAIALKPATSIPQKAATGVTENVGTYKSANRTFDGPVPTTSEYHESDGQRPASTDNTGPWLINLASLPSQSDAERFMQRARSRDIDTQQQKVTVKGKKYWRVQITGFSTAADARAYAGTVKEMLGLKDVWIMTR